MCGLALNKLCKNNFSNASTIRLQIFSFFLGALLTFSLTPFNFIVIPLIVFPIFVRLLDSLITRSFLSKKSQFFLFFITGWSFGFGYFVCGLWWIVHAILVERVFWVIPFALLGLQSFLSIYFALAVGFASFFWRPGIGRVLGLAICFGIFECLRAILFTGFPWISLGYLLVPTPILMQIAPIFGLYGLNFLAPFIFCLPVLILEPRFRFISVFLLSSFFILDFGWGSYRLITAPSISDEQTKRSLVVRLVQPSIPQNNKWDPIYASLIYQRYLELSILPQNREPVDVIIWPETALPYTVDTATTKIQPTIIPRVLEPTAQFLKNLGKNLLPHPYLIFGAIRENHDFRHSSMSTKTYNSIFTIDSNGNIIDYRDKSHLVPFGEYLPLKNFFNKIGILKIFNTLNKLSIGSNKTTLTLPNGVRFLALICYEAVFPKYFNQASLKADAIINISNDSWYGNTIGPYQHFFQARIQAVTTGLPLIRAANNGISAVIDPYGRIIAKLPYNAVSILDVKIPSSKPLFWKHIPYYYPAIFVLIVFFLTWFVTSVFRSKIK